MKKLIIGGLAVLLIFTLVTCDGLTPNINDEGGLIDVVYSADRGSLTIYLEGGVRQTTSSRAMTPDIAKFGHDFYEVVFYVGATRVARASWELGEPVGVKNVPRNINYTKTGATEADGSLTAPDAGEGYAVLFVGRRSDNTLLAVGKLTAVDGVTTSTTILPTTTTVTFTVASLTAGARLLANPGDPALATDTFLTAAKYADPGNLDYTAISAANTLISNRILGDVSFPMYTIVAYEAAPSETGTNETAASYSISSVSAATTAPYLDAIRLADPTKSIPNATTDTKRLPRYPVGDGKYNYIKWDSYDQKTKVELTNNNDTIGNAFEKTVKFTFITQDAPAGVFSFYFQIPVLAISAAAPTGVANPITWLIKPGIGTSLYDLDNGVGGTGGCILIGYKGGDDMIEVTNVYAPGP